MINKFGVVSIVTLTSLTCSAVSDDLTALEQKEIVTQHNKWRALVGVPSVAWSSSLAETARQYANSLSNCQMVHSRTRNLGENLFWASPVMYSNGTSTLQKISPATVIESWASEKSDYSYATNTCRNSKICGHYTQVVWHGTTEVGCGKSVCDDKSQIWICNYFPAGNIVGQKPY